jgi:hypothetical protein
MNVAKGSTYDPLKPVNALRNTTSGVKNATYRNQFIKKTLVDLLGETDRSKLLQLEEWAKHVIEQIQKMLAATTGDEAWTSSVSETLTIAKAVLGLFDATLLISDPSVAPAVFQIYRGETNSGNIGIVSRSLKASPCFADTLEIMGSNTTGCLELCPDAAEHLQYFTELLADPFSKDIDTDALADELIENEGLEGVQVLVITGNQNRENLVQRLEVDARAIVDVLPLYKTTKTDLTDHPNAARFRQEGADAVLFTSASTVKSYCDQKQALTLSDGAKQPAYGSIGPLTTQTLEELGLTLGFEAAQPSLNHFLVETISHLKKS